MWYDEFNEAFCFEENLFFFLAPTDREYVLVDKDGDSTRAPQTEIMSFDGISQSVIIDKSQFSGQLKTDFTIRMWMKHADQSDEEKENILCKSDRKCNDEGDFFFSLFSA